jgi:hypothetical protein
MTRQETSREDHLQIANAPFAFCNINSEPNEVQTNSAPQNDHLSLSFVKDIHVHGGKLAINGKKTAIWSGWFTMTGFLGLSPISIWQ